MLESANGQRRAGVPVQSPVEAGSKPAFWSAGTNEETVGLCLTPTASMHPCRPAPATPPSVQALFGSQATGALAQNSAV